MNDASSHTRDAATAAHQQKTLDRQQTQEALASLILTVGTMCLLFILPKYLPAPYDAMAMGFGSAALFTALLCMNPESLRSRGGSLVPALCLAVALWLLAAVTSTLLLIG